jgi:hypothetical protein
MRNIALGSGIGCATMALAPLASADTMSGCMATYACDQIDQARAELNAVSK